MTDSWDRTISSIERKDWVVVYRDWGTNWWGNHVFMTFYIFGVAASFLPFKWWQVGNVISSSIILPSPYKSNSDWVVVGGHLKWTPQRPCLGNEIALAMAFCHVAPQCILMISGTWRGTSLQDSHSDRSNQTLHTFTVIISYLSPPSPSCPFQVIKDSITQLHWEK